MYSVDTKQSMILEHEPCHIFNIRLQIIFNKNYVKRVVRKRLVFKDVKKKCAMKLTKRPSLIPTTVMSYPNDDF